MNLTIIIGLVINFIIIIILFLKINSINKKGNTITTIIKQSEDDKVYFNTLENRIMQQLNSVNESINTLDDRTNEYSVGSDGSSTYRTVSISELGYEVNNKGEIVFNKPVKFTRDVEFENEVEFTNDSTTTFNGDLFMEHGDNTKYFDTLPPGTILSWRWAEDDSNPIPNGWAVCDGTNGTPDLKDRFVLSSGDNKSINETGGEENVTLNIDQIPSHRHLSGYYRIWDSLDGNHEGEYGSPNEITKDNPLARYPHNDRSRKDYSQSVGGGESHNNMPPFYVLLYIMKLNRYGNIVSNNPYNSESARQSTYVQQ